MMRVFLLSFFIFLQSCSHPVPDYATFGVEEFRLESSQILNEDSPVEMEDSYEDTLVEGDVLNITLYHPKRKDLTELVETINKRMGFKVTEGCIRLPQMEPVDVRGLTLSEANQKIQATCQEDLSDVQIFLSYRYRSERKVEVIGSSGAHVVRVDGKMRLYEVLAYTRVIPDISLYKSYVVRDEQRLPLNLYKLIHEGDMTQNIVMQGGDRIFLADASDAKAMVMGEVPRPLVVSLPHGFIPLREAIVLAGGIPPTGDKCWIQVIRGGVREPKIYVLSWQEILHLPNDQLLLMPGDVVYVSEKPITQWNRFIDQTLPTVWTINRGYGMYTLF